MKLNYDFYTFSPKHFKKLLGIVDHYNTVKGDNPWDYCIPLVFELARVGKISVRVWSPKFPQTIPYYTDLPCIKFWPHPKYIEYFKQFDKQKLKEKQ